MTLKTYDNAVRNFFGQFFENTVWGSPSEAFKNAAMKGNDQTKLPLISVHRTALDLDPFQNPGLYRRGETREITASTVKKKLALLFILQYQVDIWSQDSDEAAAMFAELLFYTYANNAYDILEDGQEIPATHYLEVVEVADNSDISQITTRGRLYRYTIVYQTRAHIAKLEDRDRLFIRPVFNVDGQTLK